MTLNSKSDSPILAQVYVHTDHNFPFVCFNNHNDRFCVLQGVIITQCKLPFYWYNSALLHIEFYVTRAFSIEHNSCTVTSTSPHFQNYLQAFFSKLCNSKKIWDINIPTHTHLNCRCPSAYAGAKQKLHALLILAQDGRKWSNSLPGHIATQKSLWHPLMNRVCVGPSTGLNILKNKELSLASNQTPQELKFYWQHFPLQYTVYSVWHAGEVLQANRK